MEHRKDKHRRLHNLQPLSEEGGYFVETHRSPQTVWLENYEGHTRNASTKIYFMLVVDEEFGGTNFLHKNKSDIMHTFIDGWPAKYIYVSSDGILHEEILGPDHEKGQVSELLIPGGSYKAAKVIAHDENSSYGKFHGEVPFTLLTEVVTPGFDYRDRCVLKTQDELKSFFPDLFHKLKEYIAPSKT